MYKNSFLFWQNYGTFCTKHGAHGGPIGWVSKLEAGRSWLCYPNGYIGIFHLFNPSRTNCGSGADSASDRNEYLGYILGVKEGWCLGINLPPSYNDCRRCGRFKKSFKGGLVGPFQHCSRRLIVLLPSNEFLHSSPEAPRTIQARETSASEGRNYYQGI